MVGPYLKPAFRGPLMMKHRATVFLVLGAYLLASTVSGSFHVHGSNHSTAGCSAVDCAHGHAPENTAGEWESGDLSPAQVCPVCRFLAQRPIPADRVEAIVSVPLVEAWILPRAIPPAKALPSTHRSRAPPLFA